MLAHTVTANLVVFSFCFYLYVICLFLHYVCFLFMITRTYGFYLTIGSPAVARIVNRTGCKWPLRSSKVNDFYVIWKPICDFLSMINSKLCSFSHRLPTIHPWRTDRQTDRQTNRPTDGRMIIMTTAPPLLKYSRLKIIAQSFKHITSLSGILCHLSLANISSGGTMLLLPTAGLRSASTDAPIIKN